MDLVQNPELCDAVMRSLSQPSCATGPVLQWLRGHVLELALNRSSCRVIQKLLEVVGSQGRDQVLAELSPGTVRLYESQHGNHVLTKAIEVMPSSAVAPIIRKVEEKGCIEVARHRFGCRVLERLIEHCTEAEMGGLLDTLVANTATLCRHPFGNFVIKHILEHGSVSRLAGLHYVKQGGVMEELLPCMQHLAVHRTASHVVQSALRRCDVQWQCALVRALLDGPAPTAEQACPAVPFGKIAQSRYGGYVVEELLELRSTETAPLRAEARRRLEELLELRSAETAPLRAEARRRLEAMAA